MRIIDRITSRYRPDVTPTEDARAAKENADRQAAQAHQIAAVHRIERERNHFAERIRKELRGHA